ncbi:MAG: helix-turn-helix domain-containing protein [Clostridia bacterium]|nr:helix-turn-helix domain-containing protein [Clostridia bacterium]
MLHPEILKTLLPITAEEQAILDGRKTIDRSLYMEGSGNVISAEKMMERGKLIAIRPHTRFLPFPAHTHDYVEVVYMCQGSTTHLIGGSEIRLREGELLFISPGAVQEIRAAGKKDLAVNFFILPPFFDEALAMLGEEETPLRRFLLDSLSNRGGGYLHFKTADVLPVQNLVENLLFTIIEDPLNKRRIQQTTMGLLLLQLLNCTDLLAYGRAEEALLPRVLKYVEEQYRDGSLSELAALMHYDLHWLSREIKKRTGRTYTQLMQEKRLSQAAFLLKTTQMTVAEISAAVGYENISHFHRLFRATYDTSPKRFRK